jgi:predicted nucleotidyltransferase
MMITEINEKLKYYFEEHKEIQFAILFGSLAKGTSNKMSDVDIAVMVNPKFDEIFPYGRQAELITDFMRILNRNDVDVVILNDAKILLKHQVLRYGKFIYTRDMQARIQFQIDTINQYEDFTVKEKLWAVEHGLQISIQISSLS